MNEGSQRIPKAVGLLSGGLDSTLAAKVMKDLGVDIHGVYFSMPWGCCDKEKATEAAHKIGIKFIVMQLDERYLELVKNPKHGYGTALNPCVDCRIHMFGRAAQYMKHIGADFCFTGEVLGQRPMSQMKKSMKWIEEETSLQGRLLRPLCAKLLEPTIPETEGLIDRNKLLNLSGRSRSEQYRLVKELDVTGYNQPAGGCLLTDKNFARRMKDTLDHGYRNFRETIALQWGRHFRIQEQYKVILGRNAEENESIVNYAHKDDIVMILDCDVGPTALLKGMNPTENILSMTAGLMQRYSKYKNETSLDAIYWPVIDTEKKEKVKATILSEDNIQEMYI